MFCHVHLPPATRLTQVTEALRVFFSGDDVVTSPVKDAPDLCVIMVGNRRCTYGFEGPDGRRSIVFLPTAEWVCAARMLVACFGGRGGAWHIPRHISWCRKAPKNPGPVKPLRRSDVVKMRIRLNHLVRDSEED